MSDPVQARTGTEPTWINRGSGMLTWEDQRIVAEALAEIAPSWSAELVQGAPGESTIVVSPEGANDLLGPAFILHRGGDRVQLDQFRWDEYRRLGGFASLPDAMAALTARLVPLVPPRSRPARTGR
jgi:hypothetical protein